MFGYSNCFFALHNLEFGCDWQLFIFDFAEHIPFILHSGVLVHIYIRHEWWFFVNLNGGINQNITFIELTNSFPLPISTRLKRYTFPVCVNMAYYILQTTNVRVVHLFNGSFKKSKPFFSAVQFCHVLYNFHSKNMYGIHCIFVSVSIERQLTNEICSGRSTLILFKIPMWLLCDSFSHFYTDIKDKSVDQKIRQIPYAFRLFIYSHWCWSILCFFVFFFGFELLIHFNVGFIWRIFCMLLTFGSTIRPWNIMLMRNVSEGEFEVKKNEMKNHQLAA